MLHAIEHFHYLGFRLVNVFPLSPFPVRALALEEHLKQAVVKLTVHNLVRVVPVRFHKAAERRSPPMNEATEGLEDEIDDLEEEADGENDAMIISIVACAVIKAFAKAHAMSVYDDVVMAILVRWNDHPLFMALHDY